MKNYYKPINLKNHTPANWAGILVVVLIFILLLAGCSEALPTTIPTELPTQRISAMPTRAPTATSTPAPRNFDGKRALEDAQYQLELGPRTVGSAAHQQTGDWIADQLAEANWEVEIQESTYQGQPVRNIVGKWGEGRPWVVIGAHYDSRLVADHDPDVEKQTLPVPGANDGASGVAVLTELARVLPGQLASSASVASSDGALPEAAQIWLVFFDSEDNGKLPGWDWILGSRAFVQGLTDKPDAAVVIDMIGDANLDVYQEKSSDPRLNQEIWAQAASQGYAQQFIPIPKYTILDDHRPFLDAGIPAADLIDFNYLYYHTTADTLDKLSAESLQAIGDTLLAWLKTGSTVFQPAAGE
jgi:glutaminyl-peptide cyclotransferase